MRRAVPVWVVSILVLLPLGSGFAIAQAPAQAPAQGQQGPRILSGPDIGFRVEGIDRAGNPTGTLVVRINSEWLPATSKAGITNLTSR
jgi:hypothetical protein